MFVGMRTVDDGLRLVQQQTGCNTEIPVERVRHRYRDYSFAGVYLRNFGDDMLVQVREAPCTQLDPELCSLSAGRIDPDTLRKNRIRLQQTGSVLWCVSVSRRQWL